MTKSKTPARKSYGGGLLNGLAITVTAMICLFGFWKLSPGLTFAIASISFVALIALLWIAGKES
jgi:hypothetical protein